MIRNDRILIFTTLAMNQTKYFLAIADLLQKQDIKIIFISFHDRSEILIKNNGYDVYNIHDYSLVESTIIDFSQYFNEKYGINVNSFISHEKYYFNECDSMKLIDKTVR